MNNGLVAFQVGLNTQSLSLKKKKTEHINVAYTENFSSNDSAKRNKKEKRETVGILLFPSFVLVLNFSKKRTVHLDSTTKSRSSSRNVLRGVTVF